MKRIFSLIFAVIMLLSVIFCTSLCVSAEPEEDGRIESTMVSWYENNTVKCDFGGMPLSGFMGTIVDVGRYDITVTELGRYCYDSTMRSHTLRLTETDGNVLAEVTVEGGSMDNFSYTALSEPVTLKANTSYYLLSEEGNGDYYSDGCANLYGGSVATAAGYVLQTEEGFKVKRFSNSSYVGLDMKYSYLPEAEPEETIEAYKEYVIRTSRNDYHSFIGGKIAIGSKDLLVTDIGRICVGEMKQVHNLKFVDAVSGIDVPGASVNVTGGKDGEFVYAKLETPIVLKANRTYYLMSREYAGGDRFLQGDANFYNTREDDFYLLGRSYLIGGYNDDLGMGYSYVGINFKYAYADGTPVNPTEAPTEEPGEEESESAGTDKETSESPTQYSYHSDGSFDVIVTTSAEKEETNAPTEKETEPTKTEAPTEAEEQSSVVNSSESGKEDNKPQNDIFKLLAILGAAVIIVETTVIIILAVRIGKIKKN